MANIQFNGVGIRAVAACVPADVSRNADALRGLLPDDEIEKTIHAIGIREKRLAPKNVCASDLCAAAAEKLFADNPDAPRDEIDFLLFMSQTADFRTPATAPILQHRLGLPQSCAALDLSLGCSGYVYALSTAFAYAALPGVRRVLLLDGETFSKIVNPRDRVNAPLYGDAGTATLVEKSPEFGAAHFTLKTDGGGADVVKIPAGGCRVPASAETLREETDAEGNVRSGCEVRMNGMDVFNFAIRSVPAVTKETAARAGFAPADADCVVFHQANRMMTDFLAARMKIAPEKILYSLGEYGNTSSASIPLTLAARGNALAARERALLCGFGAGLSWAAAAFSLAPTKFSEPFNFNPT